MRLFKRRVHARIAAGGIEAGSKPADRSPVSGCVSAVTYIVRMVIDQNLTRLYISTYIIASCINIHTEGKSRLIIELLYWYSFCLIPSQLLLQLCLHLVMVNLICAWATIWSSRMTLQLSWLSISLLTHALQQLPGIAMTWRSHQGVILRQVACTVSLVFEPLETVSASVLCHILHA